MMVDQNSFIRERPFFADKNVTFAKLSRTLCLSFAGPMLANNASFEDSFTTCQIAPENHGSLLDSLLNMQLAHDGIPSQDRLLLTRFFWWRLTCTLTFARSFAQLSRNFAKISLFTDPGHQQGVHWRKSGRQGPWCLPLAKPHFWKLGCCIWSLFLETSKKHH